jgi:hypothetical protein
LKALRCIIGASSQMIRSILCTNSTTFIRRCNSWWSNYKHDFVLPS